MFNFCIICKKNLKTAKNENNIVLELQKVKPNVVCTNVQAFTFLRISESTT